MAIEVVRGDITQLDVDAIVNAANAALAGGGGVDGAIHRAAGHELHDACRMLGGCPTGEAKTTLGFKLRARWVIHAVGPVWHGGHSGEDALLASAYARSFAEAAAHGVRTLAFPCISTGVYGFPKDWSPLAMEINTGMLGTAKVAVPKNWTQLRTAAEKIKATGLLKKGGAPICLSADWARMLPFILQNGALLKTITSPAAAAAVNFYVGLIKDGLANTPDKLGAGWCGEALGKNSFDPVVRVRRAA